MAKILIEHAPSKENPTVDDVDEGQAFYIPGQEGLFIKVIEPDLNKIGIIGDKTVDKVLAVNLDKAEIVALNHDTEVNPKEATISVYSRRRRGSGT